jgi:hypothetical protein
VIPVHPERRTVRSGVEGAEGPRARVANLLTVTVARIGTLVARNSSRDRDGSRASGPSTPPVLSVAKRSRRALAERAVVLLIALLALPAFAQDAGTLPAIEPIAHQAKVDHPKVKLGEPFVYTIRITHSPDQRYELAVPHELGAFSVLSLDRAREDQKGQSVTTFTMKLGLFELGPRQIPDLKFLETDPTGTHVFRQVGEEVEGVGMLSDQQVQTGENLLDIKPNEQVPVRSWRLVWWLLGLLGAGALTWYAIRAFRRWRERLAQAPAAPPKPLHERTLALLDALKAEAPHQKGRVREFYFQLSEILRGYLAERLKIDALECTSSELIARLKEKAVEGFPLGDFSSFVHESDLAKYAKAELPPDTCEGALGFAYRLVELTHPPAVVPVDASGPQLPQP